MENRRSQLEILRTQKVLDSYIEYNKDKEKFTKYMPVNGGPNVYKVSDVRFDELEGAISEQIQDIVRSINTQEESECQENQMRESSKEQ